MSEANVDDNGGPAFPTEVGGTAEKQNWHQTGPNTAQFHGMTLRDYFASKAMQSIVAATYREVVPKPCAKIVEWESCVAGISYEIADVMLLARQVTPAVAASEQRG